MRPEPLPAAGPARRRLRPQPLPGPRHPSGRALWTEPLPAAGIEPRRGLRPQPLPACCASHGGVRAVGVSRSGSRGHLRSQLVFAECSGNGGHQGRNGGAVAGPRSPGRRGVAGS